MGGGEPLVAKEEPGGGEGSSKTRLLRGGARLLKARSLVRAALSVPPLLCRY